MFCDCCMIALSSMAIAIANYLCHIKKKKSKNNHRSFLNESQINE